MSTLAAPHRHPQTLSIFARQTDLSYTVCLLTHCKLAHTCSLPRTICTVWVPTFEAELKDFESHRSIWYMSDSYNKKISFALFDTVAPLDEHARDPFHVESAQAHT